MERVEPFPTQQNSISKVAYRKPRKKPVGRPPKNPNNATKKAQPQQRRHYKGRTNWTKQTYDYVKMVTQGKGAPCKIWSTAEKKQLLEALKRYSHQDWDSISKCVPTRTLEEIKEFIHQLKGGDHHKTRVNRDIQLSWAPIESWLDMSVEMVHYEQSDLSNILSRAFSILGNFSQFPPCTSPSLEPDYGKLYCYLAAVMDESLSMPDLTPLESAIIADLMHSLCDNLRMSDTSLQRKVMCWKYKMLNHKFDFDNVGDTLDRIRKALTNDFSDLQKDGNRSVSELPSFRQNSDTNVTRETSTLSEAREPAEPARPPAAETPSPSMRRGRPPANCKRPEWRRPIEKPRLYAMNPFCVPIRLLHLKPLLTDNTIMVRRPGTPRSTCSSASSATSTGSQLGSSHEQQRLQRDRDIQEAARRAQEANKLRQVTGIYVPENSRKKKHPMKMKRTVTSLKSQVSSTTLNAMKAALLQKNKPASSASTITTAQPSAQVVVLAEEKEVRVSSSSGGDAAQVYCCIELPGGRKGLIPCETPTTEEGMGSLLLRSSALQEEMPPPLPPQPTSTQLQAGRQHPASAAPPPFTLMCISPSLFRSPLRAPVAGCSVSVGTSDDEEEEDLVASSGHLAHSISHQPSTSSASAKQKSSPGKLLQRQHSAPSKQESSQAGDAGGGHKRIEPLNKSSPKPAKKQLGPKVTTSMPSSSDTDKGLAASESADGSGTSSTSTMAGRETAKSVILAASSTENGTGVAAKSCLSHPVSVNAASIPSEITQADDSGTRLQAKEGHRDGSGVTVSKHLTSEGKGVTITVVSPTAVRTVMNANSANLDSESQHSSGVNGSKEFHSQSGRPSLPQPFKQKIQPSHPVKQKESTPPQPISQKRPGQPHPVSQKGSQPRQPVIQKGSQPPQSVNQKEDEPRQPTNHVQHGSQLTEPVNQNESQTVRSISACVQTSNSTSPLKQKRPRPSQQKNTPGKASPQKTPPTQPSGDPKPAKPIIPTIVHATYKKRVRQHKSNVKPTVQEIIVRPPSTHAVLVEKIKPTAAPNVIQAASRQLAAVPASEPSGQRTVQRSVSADQPKTVSKSVMPRSGSGSDLAQSLEFLAPREPRGATPSSTPQSAQGGQAVVIRTSSNSRCNCMSTADWSIKAEISKEDQTVEPFKVREEATSSDDCGSPRVRFLKPSKTYSHVRKNPVMDSKVTSQAGLGNANTSNLKSDLGASGNQAARKVTVVVQNNSQEANKQKALHPSSILAGTHSSTTVSLEMPQSVRVVPKMKQPQSVRFVTVAPHSQSEHGVPVIPQSGHSIPVMPLSASLLPTSQSKDTSLKSSTSETFVQKPMQSTCSIQIKPQPSKPGTTVCNTSNVSQKIVMPGVNVSDSEITQSVTPVRTTSNASRLGPTSSSSQSMTNSADLTKTTLPLSASQTKGSKSSFKTILSKVASPHMIQLNPTTPKRTAGVETCTCTSPSSSFSSSADLSSPTPSKKLKLTKTFPAKQRLAAETMPKKRGRKPKVGKEREESYQRAKKRPANFLSSEDISGKEMVYVTMESAQEQFKKSGRPQGTEDYEAEIQKQLDSAKKFGRKPLQVMMDDEEISLVSI